MTIDIGQKLSRFNSATDRQAVVCDSGESSAGARSVEEVPAITLGSPLTHAEVLPQAPYWDLVVAPKGPAPLIASSLRRGAR